MATNPATTGVLLESMVTGLSEFSPAEKEMQLLEAKRADRRFSPDQILAFTSRQMESRAHN